MITLFEEYNNNITVVLGDLLDTFNDGTYKNIIGSTDDDYKRLQSNLFMTKRIKFQCCGIMNSDFGGGFKKRCNEIHDGTVYGIRYDGHAGTIDVYFYGDPDFVYHHINNQVTIEICSPIPDELRDILEKINASKFGI